MRNLALSVVVTLLFALGARPANASTIIYSTISGGTYNASSYYNFNGPGTGFDSDIAAPFTPGADYVLDSVSVALSDLVTNTGVNAADLWLMSDNLGVPGAIIEQWHFTNLPLTGSTSTALATGVSVLNPVLLTGTQYWLAASSPDDAVMGWHLSNSTSDGRAFRANNGAWSFSGTFPSPAFEIQGTLGGVSNPVPEPATLFLLGTGFGLVGLRRRRER